MKYFFVVNPFAGKGNKIENLKKQVHEACDSRGLDYVIYETVAVGDAEKYVRDVCEQHRGTGEILRIFACGGDGTVNECFNGAAGCETAELGVIPIGTGNDFVRNFGGAKAFFDVAAQLDANTQEIDLIKYNDRYCVNMINIGFDCEVAVSTSKLKTSPLIPSGLAYIAGLLKEFVRKPGTAFRCKIDGEDIGERKLLLSCFANGGYCGGGFYSAPLSRLDDGLLDYCMVNNISRFRFLTLVGHYKKGTHLQMKNKDKIFSYGKCREVELVFDTPTRICVDGEIETCENALRLQIEKKAARLVNPSGVAEKKIAHETAEV